MSAAEQARADLAALAALATRVATEHAADIARLAERYITAL